MKRLFCVILLFVWCVPVGAEDVLVLHISTDKETYEAGDRGVMDLTFTNNSGRLVENIDVEVTSKNILFLTKTAEIEKIEYGSEVLHFKFQVKDLEDGKYPVNVYYNYSETSKTCQGGICQKESDKKEYEITIKNGEPRISLESNVLKVVDSKTEIVFRNSDELAMDFTFDITTEITVQYESYIGYVLSSSSAEITVYGEPGEYDGSVEVTYKDRFGRDYTKSFLVRIIIEEEKVEKEEDVTPDVDAQPAVVIQDIRKVEVSTASAEAPLSQYYVYFVVFSCLFLIGAALIAKLKNVRE